MLAASHVWERELYEKIRALYNSIHPVECKLAPPFEEWTGMPGLCDHIFCRCSECECLLTGDSLQIGRHGYFKVKEQVHLLPLGFMLHAPC